MSSPAPVIIYSFVARGTTVLCENSGNYVGNFSQIAMQCLDKVAARPGAAASNGARGGASLIPAVGAAPPPQASSSAPSSSSSPPPPSSSSTASQRARLTYTCDRHLFNFLAEPGPAGLTFCAVSPESAGRALPFAFLERVAADFHSRTESAFSPASLASAPAHALDRAFGPRLALAADFVAQHPESASKVASVQRQVDAVRDVMVENIERVLERGERIELLVDKTDGLRDQAARFQASGRALRQRMWWNNMKMRLMVGALIASLLLVVFASVCFSGGNCLSSRKN